MNDPAVLNRYWTWTLSNCDDAEVDAIKKINDKRIQFICFEKKLGDSGAPELQGYLYSEPKKNKLYERQLKTLIPRAQFSQGLYSSAHIANFCKKDETNVWSCGTYPLQDQRTDLDKFVDDIEHNNPPLNHMLKKYPTIMTRYPNLRNQIRDIFIPVPLTRDELDNEWHYGGDVVGKSSAIRDAYPNAYIHSKTKWWDGYDREEVVVFEDADKNFMKRHVWEFKQWADHYHVNVEVRRGMMKIRPLKLIVTSRYTIEEVFPNRHDQMKLLRLFKVINDA